MSFDDVCNDGNFSLLSSELHIKFYKEKARHAVKLTELFHNQKQNWCVTSYVLRQSPVGLKDQKKNATNAKRN